ncbi:JmjC domain-containing protein 5 [Elysia marginata]|uniref:JmjC domain-containing protein 5 n=1 Tax=Elysia marginata TaxID=1093978 RepID=A0AAV4EPQ0_9GAST|nr:JmjC domain-containing protein 5 [Elysia marginata]
MRSTILVITLTLVFVHIVQSKVGFIKDQAMDAVFPGPVYSQAPSLPVGHMRPLGWQRKADGPIPESGQPLATQEFYERYVSQHKPGVFRNAVVSAPAFDTWQQDTYLTEKYGHLNVSVTVKLAKRKDKIVTAAQSMKLKDFLFNYMYDELYLASGIPRDMMEELPLESSCPRIFTVPFLTLVPPPLLLQLPVCVRCGTISERLVSAQLWMSSGGTSSRVHSHDDHLLHCVLFGRRDFILVEQRHKKAFDFEEDFLGSLGGHSNMNTEMVNAFKFKSILRTPWVWSTLYPGDCLYVPAGFLHQVRSYGRSVSTTIEFAPLTSFDNTGCTLIEEEFVPLSNASFLLAFVNGRVKLADEELTPGKLRHMLVVLMGDLDLLTEAKFSHWYNRVVPQTSYLPDGTAVFDMLTSGEGETTLTKSDLSTLTSKDLQKVADIFNLASSIDDLEGFDADEEEDDKIKQKPHEEL